MDLTSRLFMMAATGSGTTSNYWYATLGGSSSDVGVGIRVGSDNSLYINATSGTATCAAKYSPAGALTWQRRIATVSTPSDMRRLAIDSTDSTYFAFTDSGTNGLMTFAVAYNSSGALQWQKRWDVSERLAASGRTYAVCYGSNLYVSTGRTSQLAESAAGNGVALLIKATASAGAFTWARNTYNLDNYGQAVTVDASENVYMVHELDRTTSANQSTLAVSKFSSAGSRLWTSAGAGETYSVSGMTFYRQIVGYAIGTDSSVNIYVAGIKENTSSVYRAAIFKLNSSGTIQWARALGTTSGIYYGVTTDSAGNIYACGSVGSVAVVVKYDSTGAITWQRSFTGGVSDVFRSISIDSNGDLCICGNTSSAGQGSNDILVLKLPSDGSRTGTYGNFTYAVSTYTNATEVANAYTPSGLATYNQSVTVTNSSFSETAGSLVSVAANL